MTYLWLWNMYCAPSAERPSIVKSSVQSPLGTSAACVYTILSCATPTAPQAAVLGTEHPCIHAVLISDFYSQLAQLPLTASTTEETSGAHTAPTKVFSILKLVEPAGQTPPGASSTCHKHPHDAMPLLLTFPSRTI